MSRSPLLQQASGDHVRKKMTVAKVLSRTSDTNFVTVVFLESARFYKLRKKNKQFRQHLTLLQKAEKDQQPVWITLTQPDGDEIEKAERPDTPKPRGSS